MKGSNWFPMPDKLSNAQWRDCIALLRDQHRTLRETLEESPWSRLTVDVGGGEKGLAEYVHGIALHDTYHTGQIQTIKALLKTATAA